MISRDRSNNFCVSVVTPDGVTEEVILLEKDYTSEELRLMLQKTEEELVKKWCSKESGTLAQVV